MYGPFFIAERLTRLTYHFKFGSGGWIRTNMTWVTTRQVTVTSHRNGADGGLCPRSLPFTKRVLF